MTFELILFLLSANATDATKPDAKLNEAIIKASQERRVIKIEENNSFEGIHIVNSNVNGTSTQKVTINGNVISHTVNGKSVYNPPKNLKLSRSDIGDVPKK